MQNYEHLLELIPKSLNFFSCGDITPKKLMFGICQKWLPCWGGKDEIFSYLASMRYENIMFRDLRDNVFISVDE